MHYYRTKLVSLLFISFFVKHASVAVAQLQNSQLGYRLDRHQTSPAKAVTDGVRRNTRSSLDYHRANQLARVACRGKLASFCNLL